jgi:hypothetical protein
MDNIYNFKRKAQRHINYLQVIMFITIIIMYESKFLNQLQTMAVIFIILFNIAFVQNMLNNFIVVTSTN